MRINIILNSENKKKVQIIRLLKFQKKLQLQKLGKLQIIKVAKLKIA